MVNKDSSGNKKYKYTTELKLGWIYYFQLQTWWPCNSLPWWNGMMVIHCNVKTILATRLRAYIQRSSNFVCREKASANLNSNRRQKMLVTIRKAMFLILLKWIWETSIITSYAYVLLKLTAYAWALSPINWAYLTIGYLWRCASACVLLLGVNVCYWRAKCRKNVSL